MRSLDVGSAVIARILEGRRIGWPCLLVDFLALRSLSAIESLSGPLEMDNRQIWKSERVKRSIRSLKEVVRVIGLRHDSCLSCSKSSFQDVSLIPYTVSSSCFSCNLIHNSGFTLLLCPVPVRCLTTSHQVVGFREVVCMSLGSV